MHQSISNLPVPLHSTQSVTIFDISLIQIFGVWDLGGEHLQIIMNSRYYHVCVSTWGEIKKKVTRYKEMTLLWGQFNGSPTLMSCKKMEEEKEIFWFIIQPLTLEHGETSGRWQGLGRNSLTRCLYCKVTGFKSC